MLLKTAMLHDVEYFWGRYAMDICVILGGGPYLDFFAAVKGVGSCRSGTKAVQEILIAAISTSIN